VIRETEFPGFETGILSCRTDSAGLNRKEIQGCFEQFKIVSPTATAHPSFMSIQNPIGDFAEKLWSAERLPETAPDDWSRNLVTRW